MRRFSEFLAGLVYGVGLCGGGPMAAWAGSITIVHSFTGGADGADPFSTLTPDHSGNLYGTTQGGGAAAYPGGYGTLYKIDASGNLTTLYDFQGGASGEYSVTGVSLIGGILYGSAQGGPPGATSLFYSIGTDGSHFTVLHAMDAAQGNLLIGLLQPASGGGEFGLGRSGGRYGHGILFYLGPRNDFTVAHDFAGGADGQGPNFLVEDAAGNLYGSTSEGGTCSTAKHGCGTIFKYAPATRTYTILYSFQAGADGQSPLLGAVAANGTLYGVSTEGGADHHGVLYALTPGSGGAYSFSVLTPIISYSAFDVPANPPALAADGALVGGTIDAGYYVYRNGVYSIAYSTVAGAQSQFLLPASQPGMFFATSTSGGTGTACAYGCGIIYYGTR